MPQQAKVVKRVVKVNYRPVAAENRCATWICQMAKPVDPSDPLPLIVAAFGTALAGQILSNLVDSLAEGITRPTTSAVDYGSRLKTYELYSGVTLDSMIAALKASIFTPERGDQAYVNLDDRALRDAMDKIIKGTIVATTMVSEDAGEIVMEAFQEAFSNATYYGIGGMFASMTAYRAGFMPPQNPFTDPGFDLLDVATKANLDAMVGFNVYTLTAQHAIRLANKMIDEYTKSDKLDSLLRLYAHYTDMDLTMLANLDRQFETMIDHIIEQTRMSLTVLLRRTIDIRDTIRAAYADWKANILMENDFRILLLDAQLELREILSLKDEILSDLDSLIDGIPSVDTAIVGNLRDVVDRMEKALDDKWRSDFSEMSKYLSVLKQARRLVKSYGLTWSLISSKTGDQINYTWSRRVIGAQIVGYPYIIVAKSSQEVMLNIDVEYSVAGDKEEDLEAAPTTITVEVRLKDSNGNIVASQQITIERNRIGNVKLSITAPAVVGDHSYTIEAYNMTTGVVDDVKTMTIRVVG